MLCGSVLGLQRSLGMARSTQAALLPAAGPQQPGTLPGEGTKKGEAEEGGWWCW